MNIFKKPKLKFLHLLQHNQVKTHKLIVIFAYYNYGFIFFIILNFIGASDTTITKKIPVLNLNVS